MQISEAISESGRLGPNGQTGEIMNKAIITMELEVQDRQTNNGDIEEWVDIAVVQHFDDELVWMSVDPLIQMVRLLRECPMIDSVDLFVDTYYERKIIWNSYMNDGEYEVITRYTEYKSDEEWTEYTEYSPNNIDTLVSDQMEAQDNLRRDIAESQILDEIERNK